MIACLALSLSNDTRGLLPCCCAFPACLQPVQEQRYSGPRVCRVFVLLGIAYYGTRECHFCRRRRQISACRPVWLSVRPPVYFVFLVFGRSGLHAAAEGLLQVARLAEGLSGRALRKLPFQAHAFYVQVREREGKRDAYFPKRFLSVGAKKRERNGGFWQATLSIESTPCFGGEACSFRAIREVCCTMLRRCPPVHANVSIVSSAW